MYLLVSTKELDKYVLPSADFQLQHYLQCSLISSDDNSVKFWEIGSLQANQAVTDPDSAQIVSITLQAEDGIVISSDLDGVVRAWDISAGFCKASFRTLAKDPRCSDAQLINNMLIFVWCVDGKFTYLM